MTLNVGINVSFDNMWDWKRNMWELRDINSMETYVTNDEISHILLIRFYTGIEMYIIYQSVY
jgi:hypothetical protein